MRAGGNRALHRRRALFAPLLGWCASAALYAGLLGGGLLGCFTGADGRQPQADRLYYPTGLRVSPGLSTLYVANSNFDLQYAGGSVQALNLARIRDDVRPIVEVLAADGSRAEACAAAGRSGNPDPWLNPGPCSHFAAKTYIESFAFIGAFASGLLLTHEPDGPGARLFVPVRGDPSITYFEVEDDRGAGDGFSPSFRLDCLKGGDEYCGAGHRVGQDPNHSLRGIQLPPDPYGIAASGDGAAIVSAHQTQAAASLVYNDWAGAPELAYFISDLAAGPTDVAAIPEPAMAAAAREAATAAGGSFDYRPGFALTFLGAAEVDVLRYVTDEGAVPPRPFLTRAGAVPVSTNASAYDSRGIAIRDTHRRACESTCGPSPSLDCLVSCAEQTPLQVFVANREPAALLVGTMEMVVNYDDSGSPSSAIDVLTFHDSVPLNFGASRVRIGPVVNRDGDLEDRVFITCFDSRSVFVFDPDAHRVETVVRTGRGPQDVSFDVGVDGTGEAFAFMHVAHFTDSYIGVVDLDMRRPLTYGQMFASIGEPTPPKESN